MLDNQQKVINSILEILKDYTNYDYTKSINVDNINGESKQMVDGINNLGQAITKMLIENKNNGITLQNGSRTLLKNVDELNTASNDAAARLEETAAKVACTKIITCESGMKQVLKCYFLGHLAFLRLEGHVAS